MFGDLKKIRDSAKYIAREVHEKGLWSGTKTAALVFSLRLLSVLGFILIPFFAILKIRLLNVLTSRIGHLCVEIDCYVKEEALGKHPRYRALVLAREGNVANAHMLSYWERYVRVVKSSVLCSLLKPLSRNRFTCFDVSRYAVGIGVAPDFPWIQDAYHQSRRCPLISLSEVDRKRGWDVLQTLGVPREAWFVCIHCREEGYISGERQTYRNADIETYIPAMKAIIERGGWVIRMGDASMKALSPQTNTIDYARSEIKDDWMDVFLCASCRLFLGSASGLATISGVFGIASAIAQQAPMSVVLPFIPDDIGIPKLVYSRTENRYLSFAEILGSPIGNFRFDHLYEKANVNVVDNTPEDITALLKEMLDRIDGTLVYSSEDERLQERFKSLLGPSHYSYRSASRVGRDFLRKYAFLLDD